MIEAENVHFVYPNGVEALKGVSLVIREGEFVAIMGQNGAGKTTLIKHFNGLLKPTKGSVRVNVLCFKILIISFSAKQSRKK
jgi:ABC-type multidrug transport system ATPase subunit